MTRVDRRSFLIGATAAVLLTSCGDDDADGEPDGGTGSAGPTDGADAEIAFLVPTFPDGFRADTTVVSGREQRISFVLRNEIDVIRTDPPSSIELTITHDGETVVTGTWPVHRDGIVTPYYPVSFTPPEPGVYRASLESVDPVDFLVAEPDEVPIVQIGDPMRSVATPTTADPLGVEPICTRAVPCPFHEISLDEALGSGRPTVLLVATPGFCQTDICGPVVDLLIDAVGDRDDLAVVHGEVYVDPGEFASGRIPATTPVVDAYSLPYEPQLVVADADGTIVGRLDTTWDRGELDRALAPVLS